MRLQRVGRKNDPSFRVVITDSRTGPKSNKHIDTIGSYSPKQGRIEIDGEKAKAWIAKGVQPSGTVHNMLISKQVIEGKKINVLPRKSPIIDEAKVKAEADAKAAAEAAAAEAAKPVEAAPAETEEAAPAPEVATETEETAPVAEEPAA